MSVHTKTPRTKARCNPVRKKRATWREVAEKEIRRFSESGVMLRGCRYKKKLTQVALAKAIDISQNHISEMENGKRPIGKAMAKRFAAFFKTDYRVFL